MTPSLAPNPRRYTLFARHRADLKEAQEAEVRALRMTIDVLAEQVEWLRWQLTQTPHMSNVLKPVNPTAQPDIEDDFPKWMSEEEEDLLALQLNEHITQHDLEAIRSELRLPALEVSE